MEREELKAVIREVMRDEQEKKARFENARERTTENIKVELTWYSSVSRNGRKPSKVFFVFPKKTTKGKTDITDLQRQILFHIEEIGGLL